MSGRDTLTEEPPDEKWMAEEVERRREHGERERAQQRLARLAERERFPLSARLRAVETAITLTTTVSAGSISGDESGGKATPGTRTPPRADELALAGEDRHEVERLINLVRDATVKLESIVDTHRGLTGPRQAMTGTDLDKLLLQYEGRTPEDVAALEPSLGSPAAVRKSRSLMKRHREDGTLLK